MPSKGSTKAALNKTKKDCITDCGDVYKPVCAGDGSGKGNKSFGSECVLNKYNCESGNRELLDLFRYSSMRLLHLNSLLKFNQIIIAI
nr:unnamed protein product [Callosobruchus analis]